MLRPSQGTPLPALPFGASYLRLVETETLDDQLRRMLDECPTSPELEAFVLRLGEERYADPN